MAKTHSRESNNYSLRRSSESRLGARQSRDSGGGEWGRPGRALDECRKRWQTRISPGKASEAQPLEAKFNFHLAPDVMLAKLQHRTTADPYFRLILLSTVLDLQDAHTGPRDTGTEKSFASLANSRQLQDLQRACSLLEKLLKELEITERQRDVYLLPYVF